MFSNMSNLDRFCFSVLRRSRWRPMKCDKDAGFCVLDRPVFTDVHEKTMTKADYDEIMPCHWRWGDLCNTYVKLCAKVSKQESAPLHWFTQHLQHCSSSHMCANAQLTIKSHKDPGEVSFRCIHGHVPYPWSGLAQWVSNKLHQRLQAFPHISFTTGALQQRLNTLTVLDSDVLIRVDIKEFFMAGQFSNLISAAKRLTLPTHAKPIMADALWFLLGEQHIECDVLHGRMWKVTRGSGMGLLFSSDLADTAYLMSVELDGLASHRYRVKHGVKLYLRYRDDIFIIMHGDSDCVTKVIADLNNHSGDFKHTIEQVSRFVVDMLDLKIWKGPHWQNISCLDYMARFKATSLGIPLSHTSGHPPHVHLMWPVSEMRRLKERACCSEYAVGAQKVFIRRLTDYHVPQIIINHVEQFCDHVSPTSMFPVAVISKDAAPKLWCVVPYHPVWRSARFMQILHRFTKGDRAWLLSKAFDANETPVQLGLAWKLCATPFFSVLRNLSFSV